MKINPENLSLCFKKGAMRFLVFHFIPLNISAEKQWNFQIFADTCNIKVPSG